ncbi:hypothetical protein LINPERPRIM_LOCUS29678 [Linum perenne]
MSSYHWSCPPPFHHYPTIPLQVFQVLTIFHSLWRQVRCLSSIYRLPMIMMQLLKPPVVTGSTTYYPFVRITTYYLDTPNGGTRIGTRGEPNYKLKMGATGKKISSDLDSSRKIS